MNNKDNFNKMIKNFALSKTEKEKIIGGAECFCKNTCVTATWDNACTACVGCVTKAFDKNFK